MHCVIERFADVFSFGGLRAYSIRADYLKTSIFVSDCLSIYHDPVQSLSETVKPVGV